jgi:hypothetical protein
MREKAFMLIGLHSRKWLSEKMEINPITLDKRLEKDNWKKGEQILLNQIFETEKSKL